MAWRPRDDCFRSAVCLRLRYTRTILNPTHEAYLDSTSASPLSILTLGVH